MTPDTPAMEVQSGNTHPVRPRQIPSRRVEADLRRRIGAGEWAPGQPLPSVAALAAEYGVSRSTVAKAEHALAVAGLVEVVPQWGVFVAGDTPDSPG